MQLSSFIGSEACDVCNCTVPLGCSQYFALELAGCVALWVDMPWRSEAACLGQRRAGFGVGGGNSGPVMQASLKYRLASSPELCCCLSVHLTVQNSSVLAAYSAYMLALQGRGQHRDALAAHPAAP